MADLRIVDAPEIPTENITGEEKLPTGGSGNYSISLDSLADYTKTKKDLVDNTAVDSKVNGVRQELDAHIEDLLNPHQVTKGQVGLGNVDNTADADKPVSNSTQSAIISAVAPKADKTYVDNQLTDKANKADVYTKSETYTKQESSDLVNNSISTALTPVNDSLDLAKRGIANRYDSSLTYNSGERVVLTNGDIVKSTIDGNTNDPNADMTGWIKPQASEIFDESGLSQQEINKKTSQSVISIAELISIQNPSNMQTVEVLSYHGENTYGGGLFVFNADSALPDDGGRIFKASDDTVGRWLRLDRDIHIEQYGAVPSVDFDSTQYIANCLASNPNSEVHLSKGTYKITDTLGVWSGTLVGETSGSIYTLATRIQVDKSTPINVFEMGSNLQFRYIYMSGSYSNNIKIHTLVPEFSNYGSKIFDHCHFTRFSTLGNIATTYLSMNDLFVSVMRTVFTISQIPSGLASTVLTFDKCYFTYSDYAIVLKNREGVTNTEYPVMGAYFNSCGFENLKGGFDGRVRSGINVSFFNSWFENCTEFGYDMSGTNCEGVFWNNRTVQAPNVPPAANYTYVNQNAITTPRVNATISAADTLDTRTTANTLILVNKNLQYKGDYIGGTGSGIYKPMYSISAMAQSDAGNAQPAIVFNRETSSVNYGVGSSIEFKTGRVTNWDQGTISVSQWKIMQLGEFIPQRDNAIPIGSASNRVSVIYAGTGTINTSDERIKQQFRTLSEAERGAAIEIKNSICMFKFNDAVVDKGDGARWHVGVKAQQVISILESHNLSPFDYAFVCYDEWDEKPEILGEDGNITQEYQAAGNRYAIRYDELSMFILSSI